MRYQPVIVIMGVLALAAGLFSYRALSVLPDESRVPDFSFPDTEGVQRDSSEWGGKVLVINFWATWCPPCREEIPEFFRLQRSMGDQGLQFIGIAIEDAEPVKAFMSEMTFNYPVLIGGDGAMDLSVQLGNQIGILPFTVVIDRSGKVVHVHPGPFLPAQVIAIVKPLLTGGP